jgi:hypothetical protein
MSETKASMDRYPRVLNSTELRILETAAIVRYATAEDYTQMHFSRGSLTWCRTVLSRISGGGDWQTTGYLVRFPIPTARGNSTRLFSLSYHGALYLRQNGIRADWWYRPSRMRNQGFSYLAHQLACTKLYISAVLFSRRHSGYQLADAQTAYDLSADPPTTTLEINGRETSVTVIPDLWVCLEQEKDGAYQYNYFWFEIDTGSEHLGRFLDLLRARIAFLKQGYESYFQTSACIMAYVVIGQPSYRGSRLRQLRAWTAQLLEMEGLTAEWTSVFRFTSVDMDNVYAHHPQTILAAPVWYMADDCPPAPLLDITTHTQQLASVAQKENRNGHTIQP